MTSGLKTIIMGIARGVSFAFLCAWLVGGGGGLGHYYRHNKRGLSSQYYSYARGVSVAILWHGQRGLKSQNYGHDHRPLASIMGLDRGVSITIIMGMARGWPLL